MKVSGMLLESVLLVMLCCVGPSIATAQAAEMSGAEIYRQEVRQLTTLECAQCHYSVFTNIRDNGGKHQLECRFCHETFHLWRPDKAWSDVVPRCGTCHGTIHGPDFKNCLDCHADPHAPMQSLANMETLGQNCGTCHASQGNEVRQFASAHTEVACNECHHDQHGYIPGCMECHAEPHTPFADNAGCMGCHPVHSPLEINYGENVTNVTCGACHGKVLKTLRKGTKKHSELFCVYCHADRHRFVPQCRDCHAQPHNEKLLKRFTGCADCHGDPHALKLSD